MHTEMMNPRDAILDHMRTLLAERLGLLPDEVVPEARFTDDLGLDSLDMVELLTIMEEQQGSAIDDESARSLTTVGQAVDHLVRHGAPVVGAGARR